MALNGQGHVPVTVFDEFLVAPELRALLDYVLASESAFAATEVIGANGAGRVANYYRRSRVLYDLRPFQELFQARVMKFLPHVLYGLGHRAFDVRHFELQLTATNNGEFFRLHTDNGADPVEQRTITAVYFFHCEPMSFRGGELRILETDPGTHEARSGSRLIYPQQNQAVFFPSGLLHEILPVSTPGYFASSRFTLNGWLYA